ncbi:transmembrane protein 92 [Chlamydotis macqueenii]
MPKDGGTLSGQRSHGTVAGWEGWRCPGPAQDGQESGAAGRRRSRRTMFTITIIILIAVTFLIMIFHIFRKLCHNPAPPPHYGDPQGSAPPPLAPMPALPSLPGATIPVGLEPPPYSEVAAKPFLYPLPQGPCPECGCSPGAQPHFPTQTNF